MSGHAHSSIIPKALIELDIRESTIEVVEDVAVAQVDRTVVSDRRTHRH